MKHLLSLIPLFFGSAVLFMLCDFNFDAALMAIQDIAPFDWHAIGTVLYCGGIVGWERMLKNKVLGMRTSIFIILGTYIFTAVSIQISAQNDVADATRVIGQIVSGIGFLGAGVIMFNRDNKITGLTSAATIWILAAIGVCIGVGYLTTAIIITTIGVMLLLIISEIDDGIVAFSKKITANFTTQWRVYEDYNPHGGTTYFVQFKAKRFGFWTRFSNETFLNQSDAEDFMARHSNHKASRGSI